MNKDTIEELLSDIKSLAKKYQELTGKPLGVTGEVAEFAAAKILGLDLCAARQPGYDATKMVDGKEIKYQIKSRRIIDDKKGGGRTGAIKLDDKLDFVLLVLLDEDFEVMSIHQAESYKVKQAFTDPGSKSRNERKQLSIRKFKKISVEIWNREKGHIKELVKDPNFKDKLQ